MAESNRPYMPTERKKERTKERKKAGLIASREGAIKKHPEKNEHRNEKSPDV